MATEDKIRILILDDEKQFTDELIGFFAGSEYVAFEANSAEQGNKILINNEIPFIYIFRHCAKDRRI